MVTKEMPFGCTYIKETKEEGLQREIDRLKSLYRMKTQDRKLERKRKRKLRKMIKEAKAELKKQLTKGGNYYEICNN